eukprot:g8171.t1
MHSKPKIRVSSKNSATGTSEFIYSCNGFTGSVCRWTNQCIFGDLKFGHTHSPCVKSAPAAFVNYEANVVCPKQRSLSACKATRNCIWGNGFCNADYVKIYFGIDSNTFFKEADKVADAQIVELADVMDAKFNVEVSNFDWSRLLRWNAPDMSCPKRATPKVCKYSNAGTKVYLPVSAYCYGKYRSISSCNSDPLCSYNNKERSCLASAYTNWVAHTEGIGAVAKDLPNEADTHMISAYFFCPTILTQSACNGACEWSYATRSCIVRSTFGYGWIAAPMQKSSVARSDPVCRLFSYFANSGCEKLHTRFACQRNQYCLWGANNVCFVSPFRITAAVLSSLNDPSLSTSKVFPNCSGYRTAQQCASMVGPVSDPQFANHLALMNWQTSIAINTRARQSIHDFQADMFARGSSILL